MMRRIPSTRGDRTAVVAGASWDGHDIQILDRMSRSQTPILLFLGTHFVTGYNTYIYDGKRSGTLLAQCGNPSTVGREPGGSFFLTFDDDFWLMGE